MSKITQESDKPSIEWADGTKEWWINDSTQSNNPAVELGDGVRHRENGPAVEWADGTKEWWIHGERHRLCGPAFEAPDGRKEWWMHGMLHREDGPAVEDPSGDNEWFIHGYPCSQNEKNEIQANSTKRIENDIAALDNAQLAEISKVVAQMVAMRECTPSKTSNKLK